MWLLEDPVGTTKQQKWDCDAERLCGLQIEVQVELCCCTAALRILHSAVAQAHPHGISLNQAIFVTSDMVMHEPVICRLYGAGELSGVGTMICGLRLPRRLLWLRTESLASLNAGPVMVARPGIGAIVTLLPKASVASVVLATALQAPGLGWSSSFGGKSSMSIVQFTSFMRFPL